MTGTSIIHLKENVSLLTDKLKKMPVDLFKCNEKGDV